jgi:hypothetical protein
MTSNVGFGALFCNVWDWEEIREKADVNSAIAYITNDEVALNDIILVIQKFYKINIRHYRLHQQLRPKSLEESFDSAKHNFGVIIINDSFENAKQKFLMHKKR